eukprot:TRINITY_DN27798_c0_g1_i1.p3 TRINITY_DN27798_c0_g1~~TRINITY_DN27798_c0_g1_i1.p3  ORF type:complete len:155 (+),score=20.96 TRINITY_DN27798_c0_g1_i1:130-594(+)
MPKRKRKQEVRVYPQEDLERDQEAKRHKDKTSYEASGEGAAVGGEKLRRPQGPRDRRPRKAPSKRATGIASVAPKATPKSTRSPIAKRSPAVKSPSESSLQRLARTVSLRKQSPPRPGSASGSNSPKSPKRTAPESVATPARRSPRFIPSIFRA